MSEHIDQKMIDKSKTDMMLKMAKHQGYVPQDCYLHGPLVMHLVGCGKNPCVGCYLDRKVCGSNVLTMPNCPEPAREEIERLKETIISNKGDIGKNSCQEELTEARAEIEKWRELERFTGCTFMEIFGQANKLKKGKYGTPVLDIPTCSMTPESVKIHDDLCDAFESRAYNEDDVCTASAGIWAAIGVCEKLWRDPLIREREITAMLRGALKECRLSAENHTGLNSKSVIMRVYDTSREALAREQEMRK